VSGAELAFLESEIGTIEVVKSADLAVVNGSPFHDSESTKDLTVDLTICLGMVTHDRLYPL
jgi:predicted amidohydrolase YtcJ